MSLCAYPRSCNALIQVPNCNNCSNFSSNEKYLGSYFIAIGIKYHNKTYQTSQLYLLKINHIPIASDNKENGAFLEEHLSFLRIRL